MRKNVRIDRHKLIDLLNHIEFLSDMADEVPESVDASEIATDDPLPDVPSTRLFPGKLEPRGIKTDRKPSPD